MSTISADFAEPAGDNLLTGLTAANVFLYRHIVIERVSHFIDPSSGDGGIFEEVLGVILIDDRYTGHNGSSVGDGKAFTDENLHRLEAIFLKHFGSGTPFAAVMNLPLAYQTERDMGELNEIATGTDATMLRDEGVYAAIHKLLEKSDHGGVDAGASLEESADAHEHGSLDLDVGEGGSGAGGMAPDDVVLQLLEMPILDTPLRHRAKSGVDAIDHLIVGKRTEELIA